VTWTALAAVAGWVGTVLLLLAYGLVSLRRLDGDGVRFQLLNVVGSAGLGAAAVAGGVWSAATLNALWVGIGLAVLARRARASRHRRAGAGQRPASRH
jgi:hypothetical protein